MNSSPWAAFWIACACALAVTPVVARLLRAWGWVDRPDGIRKVHATPIPLAGGPALAFALVISASIVTGSAFWFLAPALAIAFLAGLADDIWSLRPGQKLMLQLMASGIAAMSGSRIGDGALAYAGSILWLVICMNGINLIDGMDGLAAGSTIAAALMLAAMAGPQRSLVLLLLFLAGAMAGFLWYNRPPARVYLGDAGGLAAGLILGSAVLLMARPSPVAAIGPACALVLPIADIVLAILRRLRKGRSILEGDREHLHHQLLARGWPAWRVLMALWGCTLCGGLIGLWLKRLLD